MIVLDGEQTVAIKELKAMDDEETVMSKYNLFCHEVSIMRLSID